MPQLNFVSPGAMAGNAIEQELMRRALAQRQAVEDDFHRRQAVETQQRQQEQLQLQQQQELRIAAAQKQAQEETARQHEANRAANIYQTQLPGVIDQSAVDLTKKYGYSLPVTQGQPTQGALQGEDASGVPQYDVIPGVLQTSGGFQYQQARQAAQERAGQAQEAQAAAAQRAQEANATREEIARMAQSGQQESRDIRNQLVEMRVNTEREKAAEKKRANELQNAGVAQGRARIRDLASGLLADPALDSITGPVEGRRDTFLQGKNVDALRRLQQLVNSLSIEERSKLKGQGQISDFEGRMLASAVSAIDRSAGPEIVRKHLKAIADAFQGDSPAAGTGTSTAKPTARELIEKYSR